MDMSVEYQNAADRNSKLNVADHRTDACIHIAANSLLYKSLLTTSLLAISVFLIED